MARKLKKTILVIWALPNSLLGICVGLIGVGFGSQAQVRQGCIEFYGGPIQRILNRIPPGSATSAMTLGHIILGQSPEILDRLREHEQVHVRQYERYGPLFIPAYLGWSLVLRLQKRDPYMDNPFEVEAYAVSDPRKNSQDDQTTF